MAGPGGRKQTLIPGRAELLLVICYLLCNLSELLTLSETVCYMHRTDTLQLLRVSSEAVHHAQAFSTAEPKHKLSSPLPAGGGGGCLHIRSSTVNPHWARRGGKQPAWKFGWEEFWFLLFLTYYVPWTFEIWSTGTPKEINLLIINGPSTELPLVGYGMFIFAWCLADGKGLIRV